MTESLESVLLEFCKVENNDDYCVICLRTGKERRLDKPKHVKKFMECLDEPFSYSKPNQLACYYCERQAEIAFHFRVAMNNAAIAHTYKTKLHSSPRLKNFFMVALQYYNTGGRRLALLKCNLSFFFTFHTVPSSPKLVLWKPSESNKILDCELRLRHTRARYQLLNTKILSINTHSSDLSAMQPGESSDVFITPDYPAMYDTVDLKGEPDDNMDSIIIYDDDAISIKTDEIDNATSIETYISEVEEYTDRINPEPVKTVLQLTPAASNIPVSQNQLPNLILHPLVYKDGVLTIPSLTISNGQLLMPSPSNMVELPQTTQIPAIDNQKSNALKINQDYYKVNTFKTPELFNCLPTHSDDKFISVNALPTCSDNQSKNGRTINKRKTPTCSDNIINSVSANRTRNINNNASVETDPLAPNEPILLQQSHGRHSEVKAPQLSNDRIDWEDKIPMDVISFVNDEEKTCKRPRHSDEASPTLGISNVTSLNEEYVNDVIDLC